MAPRSLSSMIGLGLLAALATSCGVSPQPSPPDVIFDGEGLGLTPAIELISSVVGFEAAPGTVTPADGEVIVTNLDTTGAPSVVTVRPDGGFTLAVPGIAGQTFRFQAKSGDARSEPFDLSVSLSGQGVSASQSEPPCVVFEPARWVSLDGLGDARSVVLRNQCAAAVSTKAPRLRRGLAGFSFSPTPPITLGPGEQTTLTVRAGDGNEVEDVVLLDVTTPFPARRALTLTVPDR